MPGAPDLPTRLDLYAIGRDFLVQRARKISPGIVDVEGSEANLFVGSTSAVADLLVRQLAESLARLTLGGAEGDDLDRYALDRYGPEVPRKAASGAVGDARIFRASSAGGPGSVDAGTLVETGSGVQYVTTTTVALGAGELQASGPAEIRAVTPGKATQVGARTIRRFSKPGLLFDPTLQVVNDEPTAGGEPREEDEDYRARLRDFWRTARRGVLGAIEFGALTVPGIASAQAFEPLAATGMPSRIVELYVADSSGVASRALGAKVRAALEEYRAGGIAVSVRTSAPLLVAVSLALRFAASVDSSVLGERVRAAVVEYVNSLGVNAALGRGALASVLERYRSDGLLPDDASIPSPVGDLVPPVGQTIRTTLALVSLA